MKTFRFIAPDMREAILQVRNELGAEAAIISSKKIDVGVELIATENYEEALVWSGFGAKKPRKTSTTNNHRQEIISNTESEDKTLIRSLVERSEAMENEGSQYASGSRRRFATIWSWRSPPFASAAPRPGERSSSP